MIGELADLAILAQSALTTTALVFLRVGAVMAVLPAFGERSIPERVRLVLALGFTLIVAPAVSPLIDAALARGTALVVLGLTEIVAGLALGIAIRLFVIALQITGSMAAQATSLAQIFGDVGIEPQPAMGHLLVVSGLALAVLLGLHVKVAQVLIMSYDIFSPGLSPRPGEFADWGVGRIGRAFALGFSLALPFVIASLIYNLALGVINRAMPQLMVAFVGAPAITAGSLLLMFLSLPFLLSLWVSGFDLFLANPVGEN